MVLLCVEVELPSLNYLQLVYDDRLTLSSRSLTVRNGDGVYFVRIREGDKTASSLYCSDLSSEEPGFMLASTSSLAPPEGNFIVEDRLDPRSEEF